jgi:hypothetical protein
MAKKLNLQESRVVISCLYSLTACRPVEFWVIPAAANQCASPADIKEAAPQQY